MIHPSYFNAKGSFIDNHTVHIEGKNLNKELTAKHIVIATGGRPSIPSVFFSFIIYRNIPGALEYGITSDDLFRMTKAPGMIESSILIHRKDSRCGCFLYRS